MTWAAIFDMDGVLVDSLPAVHIAFNELLAPHGHQFTEEDFLKFNGMKLSEGMKLWKKEYGIDIEYEKFHTESAVREFEIIRETHEGNPTLHALLESLKKQGVPLAVATASEKERAHEMLDIIEYKDFFDTVVAGCDVERGKPAPDLFLEAANRLRVVPERCVVVEDAPHGVAAAKAAGMACVALVTRYHSREQLRAADLVIESFDELGPGILEGLAQKDL